MTNLYIRITRPEGYEDVHHDLILQDMGIDPVWGAEVVDVEAVLRECRGELDRLSTCEQGTQFRRVSEVIAKIDEVLK